MKRLLPCLLLSFYVALGFFLMSRMAKRPIPEYSITQSSNHAIINVKDEATAQEIIKALLNDKSRDPNAKTLIRIETGNPTRLQGTLKGNGSIHIINANGIVVGTDTIIELDDAPYLSTMDKPEPGPVFLNNTETSVTPSDTVELKAHGNIYALKINEEGKISATKPIQSTSTLDPPTGPVKEEPSKSE